jgi:hypothetical protein
MTSWTVHEFDYPANTVAYKKYWKNYDVSLFGTVCI